MQPITQGKLLIAEPELKDDNFNRTVILVCRFSNDDGAFGFVINKTTGYYLHELVPEVELQGIPVYQGGPVQLDTVHFIHRYPNHLPDAQHVVDDIYWGGDFNLLKDKILSKEIDLKKVKFFLGYSGWDANQLEAEIEEQTWVVAENNTALVFNTEQDMIWRNGMIISGPGNSLRIHYPTDSQLN